ncbi:Fe-S cluster assembly transcriptional regulator IscR [Pseudorhodoferax aquiterrae]|uniref:Fe-S cluster assembly transcriptional regulator IscR n=1 Tax=Pseudorhodoferax aquiterrae TaxID=747304 RepID=A0ABQ3G506_9BURK|nr:MULTISPECIES: Rrf2 family transcriptional regulator [Comamonadaceae]GHC88439.1 Fe-S cluster assembly transcriptional regulator IscR [Pseudorhodoferax aquiterrae]
MRLTTKSRFAVNAMIDVALREHLGPVTLSAIGARQKISLSYLEQMFSRLRRSGLVESARGPGGGYTLARKASAISVADIILAVDDQAAQDAQGAVAQGDPDAKMAGDLWDSLSACMLDYMQGISLRQLADEQRAKGVEIEAAPSRRRAAVLPRPRQATVRAPNSVFAYGQYLQLKG